jgi:hypothetical protein
VALCDRILNTYPPNLLRNHKEHGITGAAVFEEVATVYLFAKTRPQAQAFMGGWVALYIQTGHRVVNMLPQARRSGWATPKGKREVGELFVLNLRPILDNLVASAERQKLIDTRLTELMQTPLA